MIAQKELVSYLHDLLQCDLYQDYAPNGLQIEGTSSIKRICSAVTASDEVIAKAVAWQAHALLVHHGYFWKGEEPVITGTKHHRIKKLLSSHMNLLAYHLPLDCHPELGNNACLGKLLELETIQMNQVGRIPNLLWSGVLSEEYTSERLGHFLEKKLKRTPLCIVGHKKPIRRIAWCTGAAQDYLEQAWQLGVDAYISGEVSERTYYQALELGINYYSCGHHATERYGIQALGHHLSSQFDLEHLFIDSLNPV